MENIISVIKKLEGLRYSKGVSEIEIKCAEERLNLVFSDDYKMYLESFGTISAKGIELTGLNVSSRINVVDVTLNERELNPNIPSNMYVIENIAIESILILQNEKSEIFEARATGKVNKIHNNLSDYLSSYNSVI